MRRLTFSFKFFVLIFLSSSFTSIHCQELIYVKEAIGTCKIANITPELARQRALDAAKAEALRKAGVPEFLISISVLKEIETREDFIQSFQQLITSKTFGYVQKWNITYDTIKVYAKDNIVNEIHINAEVFKRVIKPGEFSEHVFRSQGVKDYYKNNDLLCFTLTPLKDGYFTIFQVNDTVGRVLYPNKLEPPIKCLRGIEQKFPTDIGIDYRLKTLKPEEINSLFITFTTKYIIPPDLGHFASILEWVTKFDPKDMDFDIINFMIIKDERY